LLPHFWELLPEAAPFCIYFWRALLYPEGAAQLLPVLFLPLKSIHRKTKAGMCCMSNSHKNPAYRQAGMTKINAEGTARDGITFFF
jgi:hypothetical protein